MKIYNKEKLLNRKLQKLDVFTQDDIVVNNGEAAFIVSTLKEFIKNHKILLTEEESEEISSEENE